MPAPWSENPAKVVIEFRKGSDKCKRVVRLSHGSAPVPPQLAGRIAPQSWEGLVADCSALIDSHPHLAPATCECCAANLAGMLNFLIIGLGCFQGDSGDYGAWLAQLHGVCNRWQPTFGASGCTLSVQSVHGSYWVQIDIAGPVAPQMPAVGVPPQPYK